LACFRLLVLRSVAWFEARPRPEERRKQKCVHARLRALEAIVRVLDRARAPANAELLRRDAFGPGALARAADRDGDAVQLWTRQALVLRSDPGRAKRELGERLEGRGLERAAVLRDGP